MLKKIGNELKDYKEKSYEICDGYNFSAAKLMKRIMLFKTQTYPKGKQDSQGNYKFWFDCITPRRNAEVKNINFKAKDIKLYSEIKTDSIRVLLSNIAIQDWMSESGSSLKLQQAVETGTDFGNVVWKKLAKDNYEIVDLNNFMVLNQTAESLKDTDILEKRVMNAHDIQDKMDAWENVEDFLKSLPVGSQGKDPSKQYHIYERTGWITEKEFNKAYYSLYKKGSETGKESKWIFCKVIVGAVEKERPTHVLFIEKLDGEIGEYYKEYHRTPYSGRWLRVGMYETLFDIQTRANQIGNQIAQGLEWSAKTVFRSSDRVIAQNILTDLQSGDIIKSTDLQQVQTHMGGLDQLIADWNRLMKMADELANSYEVITGAGGPVGQSHRQASLMNMNASKFFDFMRDKLSIAFRELIEDWIIDDALKSLKKRKVIKITGDSGYFQAYCKSVVDSWYLANLLTFPPHSQDQANQIKQEKLLELMKNEDMDKELEDDMWKDFRPRVKVIITGENYDNIMEVQDLIQFAGLEQDPARRSALIEMAMEKRGLPVDTLPQLAPPQPPPGAGGGQAANPNPLDNMMANQDKALAGNK